MVHWCSQTHRIVLPRMGDYRRGTRCAEDPLPPPPSRSPQSTHGSRTDADDLRRARNPGANSSPPRSSRARARRCPRSGKAKSAGRMSESLDATPIAAGLRAVADSAGAAPREGESCLGRRDGVFAATRKRKVGRALLVQNMCSSG
jgi:hypothetical protein